MVFFRVPLRPTPPPFPLSPHHACQSSSCLRLQISYRYTFSPYPHHFLSGGKPSLAAKTVFVMSSKEKPGSPAPQSSREPKDENEDDEEEINLMNAFMSGEKTFYSPLPPVKPTSTKPSGSRKRVAFAEPREEPSKAPKMEHRQIPMPAELMVPNSRRTPWKALVPPHSLPCTLKRQNPNYWWSAVTPEHRIPPVLNENESANNSRLGNSSQGRLGS
ncbi:unnamed protein product [Tuber aestivum]|uniref:Uncharacterized protein n=1 Tax=Tuber aestivum TaxID=59557 RepID=A0A292Q5J6_9PEZI|nr:unnamed protein product [Tuber aestivum]